MSTNIENTTNPEDNVLIAKLSALTAKLEANDDFLSDAGYCYNGALRKKYLSEKSRIGTPFNLQNVAKAMRYIPHLVKPCKTIREKTNSYWLKGQLEDYIHLYGNGEHTYCSNGDFIAAMLLMGYECKFDNTPNCTFNCTVLWTLEEYKRRLHKN